MIYIYIYDIYIHIIYISPFIELYTYIYIYLHTRELCDIELCAYVPYTVIGLLYVSIRLSIYLSSISICTWDATQHDLVMNRDTDIAYDTWKHVLRWDSCSTWTMSGTHIAAVPWLTPWPRPIQGVLGRQIHGGCCCGLPSPWEAWSCPLALIWGWVSPGATQGPKAPRLWSSLYPYNPFELCAKSEGKTGSRLILILFVVIGGKAKDANAPDSTPCTGMWLHNPIAGQRQSLGCSNFPQKWDLLKSIYNGLHGLHILYMLCFSTETSGQGSSMLDAARSVMIRRENSGHPGTGTLWYSRNYGTSPYKYGGFNRTLIEKNHMDFAACHVLPRPRLKTPLSEAGVPEASRIAQKMKHPGAAQAVFFLCLKQVESLLRLFEVIYNYIYIYIHTYHLLYIYIYI